MRSSKMKPLLQQRQKMTGSVTSRVEEMEDSMGVLKKDVHTMMWQMQLMLQRQEEAMKKLASTKRSNDEEVTSPRRRSTEKWVLRDELH
ncbi:hypothetical protein L6452_13251 [Arctium lappa]|uniref:Uncharacterized protein n=1 Tax=Arctium lappa TaxID=4217 RepID=A0ACB9CHQ4_ARCLA|nr:hypothetical protein L6452_13251 [Arctium lappa]